LNRGIKMPVCPYCNGKMKILKGGNDRLPAITKREAAREGAKTTFLKSFHLNPQC